MASMNETRPLEEGLALLRRLPDKIFNLFAAAGSVGTKRGERTYLVGGVVRDLVLGAPNLDVDLVVEGDALKSALAMQRRFGGEVVAHVRFKTATWRLYQSAFSNAEGLNSLASIDFITARRETYAQPGALPGVEPGTIADDLARRDFTINAIAILLDDARTGQLLDPFGGLRDLREGSIRVLHDQSFGDDPTRIFRAVRYEQRLDFRIEPHTQALIAPALEILARVSGERIWHELMRIGAEGLPERSFRRLEALGVLRAIDSGLELSPALDADFSKLREELAVPDPFTYFATLAARLPVRAARALEQRLHLTSAQRTFVAQLQRALVLEAELGDPAFKTSAIVRLLDPLDEDVLRIAQVLVNSERARERIAHFRTQWRELKPLLDGKRLQRLGIVPGPIFRQILEAVRSAQLDAEISGSEDAEQLALALANHASRRSNDHTGN